MRGWGRGGTARLLVLIIGLLGLGTLPGHASDTASISGTLRDPSGAPIAWECARAEVVGTNQTYPSFTDDEGRFLIDNLPAGSYWLVVGCRESEWVRTYYGADGSDQRTVITLAEGESRVVDATTFKGGRLAGRVVDDLGQPVPNSEVSTRTGPDWKSVKTGQDGRFVIKGMRPGLYELAQGGGAYVLSSGRSVDDIELVQTGRGRITGRVVDQAGVPVADVCPAAIGPVPIGSGRTDATGTYAIENVPAGSFTVEFRDCGAEKRYPTTLLGGVYQPADATYLQVTPRQTTEAPDHAMLPGGSVSGTVWGPDGQPFAGACVNVPVTESNGGDVRSASTDASGNYTVRALPPGQVHVWFGDCAGSELLGQYHGGEHGHWADNGDAVSVSEGADTAAVDGTLAHGAFIEGTVSHASDGPTRTCVQVHDVADPNTGPGWTVSQYDGQFRVGPLRAADHALQLYPCGTTAWASEWWQDAYTHADATPVTTTVGETVTVNPVVSAGARVSGVVRAGSDPVSTCVTLDRQASEAWPKQFPAAVGADGSYAVTNLPAGTYSVTVGCAPAERFWGFKEAGRFEPTALPEPLVLGPDEVLTGFDVTAKLGAPIVAGVTPSFGSGAGGDAVALVGQRLGGVTEVRFGDQPASSVSVLSPHQVDAVAPPGEPGTTVDVVAIGPGGASEPVSLGRYTYTSQPQVSAVSPAVGSTEGGNEVRITGGLLTGATAVRFGGVPAPAFTVESDSVIVATAPPASAAGPVPVQVETPGGLSHQSVRYTYEAPLPEITSVSPAAGPLEGGNEVALAGSRLDGVQEIRFGDQPAWTWWTWDDTVYVRVPPGAPGVVPVTVTTHLGTSKVAPVSQYEYVGRPTVTSVSPSAGPESGGGELTVTGTGFDRATDLWLGGRSVPFTAVSPTAITAAIPPGTGTVEVQVESPGGLSEPADAAQYAYVPAPRIDTVTPGHGSVAGGSSVTLTGAGLDRVDTLKVDGAAVPFTVGPQGEVTFTAPAHARGLVDIEAASIGGTTVRPGAYRYVDAPHVTSVGSGTVPVTGGTVTMTGVDFLDVTRVELYELRPVLGPVATPLTYRVLSDQAISVDLPPHLPGDVFVSVTTAYGQSPLSEGKVTYGVGLTR